MAITWEFKKPGGVVKFKSGIVYPWYEGNCLMICNNETRTEDTITSTPVFFFVDVQHAKNCLGIGNGEGSIFDAEPIEEVTINRKYVRQWKDIVALLLKGCPGITITIREEADKGG